MDFHILIVITCVFLASLFSLLFINKFFRRKTFEEIIAEKKALTEKIYGQGKSTKKPKKLQQQLKKELKREKKLKRKDSQKDTEADDSDLHSENPSVEENTVQLPRNQKDAQVEFSKVEIVTDYDSASVRSNVNVDNQHTQPQQQQPQPQAQTSFKGGSSKSNKKRGNSENGKNSNATPKTGILINKNEPVNVIKEVTSAQSIELNHFETKQPKDAVELKKIDKQQLTKKLTKKSPPLILSSAASGFNNNSVASNNNVEANTIEINASSKELKQMDEKITRQASPKNQNNKLKQQKKRNEKDFVAIDKLSETDIIGVSLLMNLFSRAELNRSEIQILIDYLLNKQQDMPSTHSEWSDDIVQKLKRQLEEKEKKLQEEQEASIGIQAKLRDLRQEINTERAQMNATIKAYIEEVQAKKQEVAALNQEMQTINDKITLERQQFQTKLRLEKQAGSQDLLVQLQRENERYNMLQNELAHKDKCLTELTCIVNASHQAVEESKQKSNEIIQTQVNQIRALEQKLDESEVLINEQRYALEQHKKNENEIDASKVEVRNLQNALDSTKSELLSARKELESSKSDLMITRNEVNEKKMKIELESSSNSELSQKIEVTSLQNNELKQQIQILNEKNNELLQQVEGTSIKNNDLSQKLSEYMRKCEEISGDQHDVQDSLQHLRTLMVEKDQRLLEYEELLRKLASKENELLQQLQEQKEKNNQQQQHSLLPASDTCKSALDSVAVDEQHIRELFERLYPEATKKSAALALSLSLEQWIEQILTTHFQQSETSKTSSSNKSTETNSSSHINYHSTHHNHINSNNSDDVTASNNSNNIIVNDNDISKTIDQVEFQKLRAQNDELTKLVKKTSNTLIELEAQAREQDEHWRSIVRSKEEEINILKHSNGEQNI